VTLHKEGGKWAFVEFRKPEYATAALQLNGQVTLMGSTITIARPAAYVDPNKILHGAVQIPGAVAAAATALPGAMALPGAVAAAVTALPGAPPLPTGTALPGPPPS
jgi:hypothetical protein